MLTVADHINRLQHALGGTPDSRHSLYDSLNMAGRRLVAEHDWVWRNTRDTLATVEGKAFIELPEDFGGLVSIHANLDGELVQFRLVSLEELTRLRTQTVSDSFDGCIYGAFMGNEAPSSAEEPSRPAIWIWPTAGDSEVSLEVVYTRKWVEASQGDTQRVPNIPIDFEWALYLGSAAVAFRVQQPTTGKAEEFEAAYMAEVQRMRVEDGRRQPFAGRIKGGVSDFYRPNMDPKDPGVSNFGTLAV